MIERRLKMDIINNIKYLRKRIWAKNNPGHHIHCIICSKYRVFEDGDYPDIYICGDCVKTFTTEYLFYRINCDRNNIHKPEFDVLEERLTFGAKCSPDPEDNGCLIINEK